MLKITLTQSAKNLPSDMAKATKVNSGTSSTTRSAKNLSALVDMAEHTKVGKDNGSDDKTVKRSPFSKKPNVSIRYFISLCFRKK